MVRDSEPEPTNVILLCDDACMKGLFATINSVVRNCATPEHLHFYVGLSTNQPGGVDAVAYTLSALFGNAVSDITVVDVNSVGHLVQWYKDISKLLTTQRTANLMNYARFFVADMFPRLAADPKNTYVYMDVDKIVYGDVRAHDLELRSKYGQGGSDTHELCDDGQFVVVGLDDSRTVRPEAEATR
jgi:lipopolysaccharide biosynthesis glycosyltransferase